MVRRADAELVLVDHAHSLAKGKSRLEDDDRCDPPQSQQPSCSRVHRCFASSLSTTNYDCSRRHMFFKNKAFCLSIDGFHVYFIGMFEKGKRLDPTPRKTKILDAACPCSVRLYSAYYLNYPTVRPRQRV